MLHVNGFIKHFGGHVSATAKETGSCTGRDDFSPSIEALTQGLRMWDHPKKPLGNEELINVFIGNPHVLDSNINSSA